jgi:hypothetical protein
MWKFTYQSMIQLTQRDRRRLRNITELMQVIHFCFCRLFVVSLHLGPGRLFLFVDPPPRKKTCMYTQIKLCLTAWRFVVVIASISQYSKINVPILVTIFLAASPILRPVCLYLNYNDVLEPVLLIFRSGRP